MGRRTQTVVATTDRWPRGFDSFPFQRLSPVWVPGTGSWETCSGDSLRSLVVCLPPGHGLDFSRSNSARRRTNVLAKITSRPLLCQITREPACRDTRGYITPPFFHLWSHNQPDVPNGVPDPSFVFVFRIWEAFVWLIYSRIPHWGRDIPTKKSDLHDFAH